MSDNKQSQVKEGSTQTSIFSRNKTNKQVNVYGNLLERKPVSGEARQN